MGMGRRILAASAALCLLFGMAGLARAPRALALPPVRHVFIIVLENKGFADTFGAGQPVAPYLTQTLPSMGVLVPGYYGTGHSSADNYIAMASGQPPTTDSKNDCPNVKDAQDHDTGDALAVKPDVASGPPWTGLNIASSDGCVYPANFPTVADQLATAGFTWKGYMENIPGPCSLAHDAPGNYQRKHNPFAFFQTVRARCGTSVVGLSQLAVDLGSVATTPNYAFITPNECNDGHTNCSGTSVPGSDQLPVNPSDTPAELAQADAFLKQWVPRILQSPAYKQDGLLIVAFDESDSDVSACCGEQPGPQDPQPGGFHGGPGESPGPGGGQTGAVMLSPFITPGSVSTVQYNHYSLLRSIEDLFGLSHLGFAGQAGLTPFGSDIFSRTAPSGGGSSGAGPGGAPPPGARRLARTELVAGGTVRLPQSAGCFSGRKFTIRARSLPGLRVRALDVYVNRRLVARVRGRRLRAPVNLTGLPRGTFTVGVVVHARRGGRRVTLRDHRRYHTCALGPRRRARRR